MPTYTYACGKCGHSFDVFHAMSASPKVKCEECGAACKKQIGTGAGIIFKGSGFYETDFKEKKGKPEKKDGGESKSETKAETKSEGKAESKPGKKADAKPAAKSKKPAKH